MTNNEIKLNNAAIKLDNLKEQLDYKKYIAKVFPGYIARQNLKIAEKELEEAQQEYSNIFDIVYPDPIED